MRSYSIREQADERVKAAYKEGRISWEEYKSKKEEHRKTLFDEEMASCREYKEAIAAWTKQLSSDKY